MRIIGCDSHARQQTLSMLETTSGEAVSLTLTQEGNQVREFYCPASWSYPPGDPSQRIDALVSGVRLQPANYPDSLTWLRSQPNMTTLWRNPKRWG